VSLRISDCPASLGWNEDERKSLHLLVKQIFLCEFVNSLHFAEKLVRKFRVRFRRRRCCQSRKGSFKPFGDISSFRVRDENNQLPKPVKTVPGSNELTQGIGMLIDALLESGEALKFWR
jgi:hypothetical protein